MKPQKISRELLGAVAEEQKAHAIDAAKKQAVAQHADYDTFKKMVSVAHLKPLHAPACQGSAGRSLPSWHLDPRQLHASCSSDTAPIAPCSSSFDSHEQLEHSVPAAATVLPHTSQEFAREWRRQCRTAADKFRLMKQCGPEGLAAIFRVEVDGLLLGQMLQALQQHWQQQVASAPAHSHPHAQQQSTQQPAAATSAPAQSKEQQQPAGEVCAEAMLVLRMLQSLTGAGRFDLSVRLLDSKSRAAAAELCSQLQEELQHAPAQQQQQQDEPSGSSSGVSERGSGSSSGSTDGGFVSHEQAACGSRVSHDSTVSPLEDLQAVMLQLRL